MRFNLVINLERISPDVSMTEVLTHTTEMVQMADQAGFDIVWGGGTSCVGDDHRARSVSAADAFCL